MNIEEDWGCFKLMSKMEIINPLLAAENRKTEDDDV